MTPDVSSIFRFKITVGVAAAATIVGRPRGDALPYVTVSWS
jgi:hypothetical protein